MTERAVLPAKVDPFRHHLGGLCSLRVGRNLLLVVGDAVKLKLEQEQGVAKTDRHQRLVATGAGGGS